MIKHVRSAPNSTADRAIAAAMLRYRGPVNVAPRAASKRLPGWEPGDAPGDEFVENSPNAVLFCAFFDRAIATEVAWRGPRLLSQRLGHFDLRRIALMAPEHMAQYVGRFQGQPALHRYVGAISEAVVACADRLLREYHGNAANIWPDGSRIRDVKARLIEFRGIGQKIGSMLPRLLVSEYGVRLHGWEDLDIAVDRHVARVFLRAGLVGDGVAGKRFSLSDVRAETIAKARAVSPTYPGALDEAAFWIGHDWCTAEYAWCRGGSAPCPLAAVCPQGRRHWQIV